MIKAVLFDFDGVLTVEKTGSTSITRFLAQRTGIALETVRSSYYRYNQRLLAGELTHEQMWTDFCRDVGRQIDYRLLTEAFEQTALDAAMINYAQKLKETHQLALVTDNKVDRIETILKYQGLEKLFDVVAVSAQLHMDKTERNIFEYVLKRLGVQADQCVFVDNSEKNLIVPAQLGIRTVLFDDEHRDVAAFQKEMDAILQNNLL